MSDRTVEDISSVVAPEVVPPAIVMVLSGTVPSSLTLTPSGDGVVQLGRRIAGAGITHEVDDERMSRDHATVQCVRGGWRIVDQGSRNGTHVDGAKLEGETIRPRDVVLRLGHTVFVLLRDGRGYPTTVEGEGDAIVGPELARVHAQIRAHAIAGDALLVHGESGSGKELAARAYHDARTSAAPKGAERPFVAVNCATIPEGVAERLLFGSKRGAFSGAVDAVGFVQSAHGGTLFLDEIADLHPSVQAKLLRVIETREVLPVGATTAVPVEIGLVAASHRELRRAVADKLFRDDLYYRLARAVVHLPPVRARKVDTARLTVRELEAVDPRLRAHAKLVEACCLRTWPGNVRELRAAVRQAGQRALRDGRHVVRADDLPEHAGELVTSEPIAVSRAPTPESPPTPAPPSAAPRRGGSGELDRATVVDALARANGVVSVAARELGLHRTQMYRVMDRLGIAREE